MLRINLLPSYVQQRRLTKTLVPIFIAIFALCVAAPLAAYFYLHGKLTALTQEAQDAVAGKGKTDALKAQAVTTLSQVAPIQAKLQFLNDVYAYKDKWIALYSRLADTTPKNSFIYTGAQVTGPTMAIKAYSPSVEEVGRYLQVMYHEPDFSTVAVDHIPAYPDNVRHLYSLNGVLVFADGASGSGTSQGGFGGGSGSAFGGRGGYPGGSYPGSGSGGPSSSGGGQNAPGSPANWTPDALGPNGPANIPPDVGPPPPQIAVGGTTSTGGQAGGGQAGGGYSQRFLEIAGRNISPFASPAVRDAILAKALRHVVVQTVAKGFDINVTATLKQPLTPPTLPGAAPAAGAGGAGGYPGGGSYPGGGGGSYPGGAPGGYPGGPPGGLSGPRGVASTASSSG